MDQFRGVCERQLSRMQQMRLEVLAGASPFCAQKQLSLCFFKEQKETNKTKAHVYEFCSNYLKQLWGEKKLDFLLGKVLLFFSPVMLILS